MQKIFLLLVLVLVPANVSQAALVITEVMSSSSGVTDDWWELTNSGVAPVDLTGYYWDDGGATVGDGALFGSVVINPGQSIIISESTEAVFTANWGSGITVLDQTFFTGPNTFSGLSSNGDQIRLWDTDTNPLTPGGPPNPAANLVASVQFGAATAGFSFEWDQAGAELGLSVAGELGAFSAGGDVGSPGISAVPEPGSMLSLAMISVGMLSYRRSKKHRLFS